MTAQVKELDMSDTPRPCCAQTIERAAKVAEEKPLWRMEHGFYGPRDIAKAIRSLPIEPVSEDDVERVARAIYEAESPLTGDALAVTIHLTEHIAPEGTIEEQLAQVMDVCRSAARAAIAAMGGKDAE